MRFFLFLKKIKITKRWDLCLQTPVLHIFMFLRANVKVVEKLRICFQQMFCFCFFGIREIFTSHLSRFCWQGVNNIFAFDIG